MYQSSHEKKQKKVDQNLQEFEQIWTREKVVNQNGVPSAG